MSTAHHEGVPSDQGTQRLRVLVGEAPSPRGGTLALLLHADPALDIVGWAGDEESVVRSVARLRPDIVLIDLHLPASDVARATRRLMQETPLPIVVVAAMDPDQADAGRSAAALAAGALAVVQRPVPGPAGVAMGTKLLNTLKSMAQVRVVRRRTTGYLVPPPEASRPTVMLPLEVVVIGASTGGPQALQEILTRLPASFAPPVLVVQHIALGFVAGLVEWLAPLCALPLALATNGIDLSHPGIHIAPTGKHLVVRGRMLALTDDLPVRGHRPSATVLFSSVASAYGPRAAGVLLTGMGDDGAAGLLDLQRAGGTTIAQDAASSVVFGMPAAAIALGAANHVLAPREIAALLIKLAEPNAGG